MKYYYFGTKPTHIIKRKVIDVFSKLQIKQTTMIENEISDKIRELDSKNTPICRGVLDTEYHVIDPLKNHITIFDKNENTITGIIIFFIQHNEICIDTLCTPDVLISKGKGKELVDTVKKISKIMNMKRIFLSSTKTAVTFYQNNGFIIDPDGIVHKDYPYIDMISMNTGTRDVMTRFRPKDY